MYSVNKDVHQFTLDVQMCELIERSNLTLVRWKEIFASARN